MFKNWRNWKRDRVILILAYAVIYQVLRSVFGFESSVILILAYITVDINRSKYY